MADWIEEFGVVGALLFSVLNLTGRRSLCTRLITLHAVIGISALEMH